MKKNIKIASLLCILWSVATINVSAQYLKSDTTLSNIYNYVKSSVDSKKMDSLTREFIFKTKGTTDSRAEQCVKFTALAYANEGNLEKVVYWLGQYSEKENMSFGIVSIIKEFLKANYVNQAEKLFNSDFVKQVGIDGEELDELQGIILFQQGKFEAAKPYLKIVFEKSNRNAEKYAIATLKAAQSDNDFKEVIQIVRKQPFLSENFSSNAKQAFVSRYGSAELITRVLDSNAIETSKLMEKKVAKMAIDLDAPNFELTNLEGKRVRLNELRGKTIFIDFWATWCGPCVYSFPGMQKAVDYYKNDPSIVFLFVHSYERVPDAAAEVKRYIQAKKYRFEVCMDLKSVVAKKFNVNALPTKLVIDANGKIKVRGVGLIMEEEAISEIKAMIELSKKI